MGRDLKGVLVAIFVLATLAQISSSAWAATGFDPGISLKIFAWPSQVQAGKTFEVLVVVSNTGQTSVSNLSFSLVVPGGWTEIPLGSRSSLLGANQSELLRYNVTAPENALAGAYTLIMFANSSSTSAQNSLTVSVQSSQPSLPVGGGQIPVSLVLILIPGFLTVVLIEWARGQKIDSVWQVSLLSFFFGSLAWFLGTWPFTDVLNKNILNLDPTTTNLAEFAGVGAWAVAMGLVLALGFEAAVRAKQTVEAWVERSASDYLARHRGYYRFSDSEWGWGLQHNYNEGMRRIGMSFRPSVEVFTVQSLSEKQTETPIKALLAGYDDKDPFDILVGPQYVLEVKVGGEGWKVLTRAFPPEVKADVSDPATLKKDFVKYLRPKMDSLWSKVRAAESMPRPIYENGPDGQKLIRGSDVRRIQFGDYKSKFVFRVKESDGKIVTDLY